MGLRQLSLTAGQLMLRETPGLFQDFERGEDGSWVPEHRKV